MKVLVTGASGQLGRELVRQVPVDVTLKAVDRQYCDLTDPPAIAQVVAEFEPNLIINAAAYTAVDKAETERDAAWRVNAQAPALLAQAAQRISHCRLLQLSTDYVFAGDASRPYGSEDETGPVSVYGQTKLEGERAALAVLGARALVLRTAWVYGLHNENFVHTMLRLMRERGSVRVVADQIGCPTATVSLAEVLWRFGRRPGLSGVYHWCDAGVASWYDFAVAIAEEATVRGLLAGVVDVLPIATEDYPTPARRPRFSLLDSRRTAVALAIRPLHWRVRLRQVLDEMTHG